MEKKMGEENFPNAAKAPSIISNSASSSNLKTTGLPNMVNVTPRASIASSRPRDTTSKLLSATEAAVNMAPPYYDEDQVNTWIFDTSPDRGFFKRAIPLERISILY